MAVRDGASGLADWGGGPSIQEGGPEGVFQLSGDHTLQPPWESLFQSTREENSADCQTLDSTFVLAMEHWTSSIPSAGCLRVHGSLPNQSTFALWTWRRHSTMSFIAFCEGLCGPCTSGAGALFTLPAVSQTCSQYMLDCGRAALCHQFCSLFFMERISRHSQGLEGVTGFHLCFSQTMLSCWLLRARTSSMSWGGLQPSVESMVLDWKRWLAPSGLGKSSCLRWRSLSIFGSCSRVRERWSARLTGGSGQRQQ